VIIIFGVFAKISRWFKFKGAPDDPGAAEIDVATFADVVELEVVD
jgi:hypothetical protein